MIKKNVYDKKIQQINKINKSIFGSQHNKWIKKCTHVMSIACRRGKRLYSIDPKNNFM